MRVCPNERPGLGRKEQIVTMTAAPRNAATVKPNVLFSDIQPGQQFRVGFVWHVAGDWNEDGMAHTSPAGLTVRTPFRRNRRTTVKIA
jgi:hypothetical protein